MFKPTSTFVCICFLLFLVNLLEAIIGGETRLLSCSSSFNFGGHSEEVDRLYNQLILLHLSEWIVRQGPVVILQSTALWLALSSSVYILQRRLTKNASKLLLAFLDDAYWRYPACALMGVMAALVESAFYPSRPFYVWIHLLASNATQFVILAVTMGFLMSVVDILLPQSLSKLNPFHHFFVRSLWKPATGFVLTCLLSLAQTLVLFCPIEASNWNPANFLDILAQTFITYFLVVCFVLIGETAFKTVCLKVTRKESIARFS
jgi:hypothetical protein